ncbi:hypothetical protein [Methylobacterium nigriterrae]|uniref:hypothetical protein n=1 Tax=Methylobacterium nigriterrae TaxID=3127512 RepID=UPI003013C3BB
MNERGCDLGWVLILQSQQARAELEDAIRRSQASIARADALIHELTTSTQRRRESLKTFVRRAAHNA